MMCMCMMWEEGARVDISGCLPASHHGRGIRDRWRPRCSNTYPGSLSVLFIEKAKCLPSEVNSSGR